MSVAPYRGGGVDLADALRAESLLWGAAYAIDHGTLAHCVELVPIVSVCLNSVVVYRTHLATASAWIAGKHGSAICVDCAAAIDVRFNGRWRSVQLG